MPCAPSLYLPAQVGNRLLTELGWVQPISADLLRLFAPAFSRLSQVHLVNPPLKALGVLRLHSLDTLAIRSRPGLPIAHLLSHGVGKGTREALRSLDLSYSLLPPKKRYLSVASQMSSCVAGLSGAFPALSTLKLRGAPLDDAHLETLAAALPNLRHLDLANTNVTSIKALVHRQGPKLETLVLYGVELDCECVGALCDFEELRILDISRGAVEAADGPQEVYHGHLLILTLYNRFVTRGQIGLPRLRSLELAHLENYFEETSFASFLNTHALLAYLGLVGTNADAFNCLVAPERRRLIVTGSARTAQLLLGVSAYCRQDRVKGFYDSVTGLVRDIRHLTFDTNLPPSDVAALLPTLLRGLREFSSSLPVLVSVSAALNLLYSDSFPLELGLSAAHRAAVLQHYLHLTARHIDAKATRKLNRNIWLFLQTQFVDQRREMDPSYAEAFVTLGFEVMIKHNGDMTLLPRILQFIRATLVEGDSVHLDGVKLERAVEFLVKLSKRHERWVAENDAAPALGVHCFILESAVHILVSLTDESVAACLVLQEQSGANRLLVSMLSRCALSLPPDPAAAVAQHRLLLPYGLLLLLAGVASAELLTAESLQTFTHFLMSPAEQLDFVAGGLIANLAVSHPPKDALDVATAALSILAELVMTWDAGSGNRAVGFRTFRPFARLVAADHLPPVQLWALWALLHSTHLDKAERQEQMRSEGLFTEVTRLLERQVRLGSRAWPSRESAEGRSAAHIAQLCRRILRLFEPQPPMPAPTLSC